MGTKTGAVTQEAARKAGALHHVEYNHTQTHHRMHEYTNTHAGLLHSQLFLLHSQCLQRLYLQGWLRIAEPCMVLKHRQQPAQKHIDSKARRSMAQVWWACWGVPWVTVD